VVRELLEKNEIVRAGTYLSKIDERNFSLEHSTTTLMIDLFSSKGTCREHIKFLPAKYHFLGGANPVRLLISARLIRPANSVSSYNKPAPASPNQLRNQPANTLSVVCTWEVSCKLKVK